jgi:iron complex outermembrane recepter protein
MGENVSKTGGRFGAMTLAMVAAAGPAWAQTASDQAPPPALTLPSMEVIGNTPLPGSGVDIDKVPANVQVLGTSDLQRDGEDDLLPTAAARRLSSINLNDEQGSQFQPDFVYRGFEASPIQGVPEGIAVYQNGVRINEAFGDGVNWDLIPQFAVNRMTIQSNNPVFGLNALGGAVTLDMKNGFNFHGTDVQESVGSYGNATGYAEEGAQYGNFGFYAGIGGGHDDGFRYDSTSNITQGYADIGWEKNDFTLHLSVSAADNYIGAVGPTPIQMLEADPRSVFTYPQAMRNDAELVQLTATYRLTPSVLVTGDVYYRHYNQVLIDGNTTDVTACTNNPAYFCLEGNDHYPGDVLYDPEGNRVPTSVLPAGATPGEIDFSFNNTNTVGTGLQATDTQPILGHDNNFVVGASFDHSMTDYSAYGELCTLLPDLDCIGSGVIIDQGKSPTAQAPIEEPVSVGATTEYIGLYATDTFDITPRLAATLSGRLNLAQLQMQDQLGTALNSHNTFVHFNPGIGFTYKLADNVTAYAGFSESNRAPTAAELSCSDPKTPCLLDAFLVADPPLKQVVSQTFEVGVRGRFTTEAVPGEFVWNLSGYRTDSLDDILLLATQINGFGFFDNVGTTRRQGIEAGLAYHWDKFMFEANYSFLDATFLENLTLSSNSPAANAAGNIFVHPGDHLPLMPANRITLGVEYRATQAWRVGADLRFVSSQYLVGDESNQEPQLPAYTTVDLHTSYQVTDNLMLFAEIDDLFNKTYYTYGTFTELDGLPPNFNLTDPRTYSPSPGRTFFAGARLSF